MTFQVVSSIQFLLIHFGVNLTHRLTTLDSNVPQGKDVFTGSFSDLEPELRDLQTF
jgi:hypothetical protein